MLLRLPKYFPSSHTRNDVSTRILNLPCQSKNLTEKIQPEFSERVNVCCKTRNSYGVEMSISRVQSSWLLIHFSKYHVWKLSQRPQLQKEMVLTTTSHVYHAFLYISLPSLHIFLPNSRNSRMKATARRGKFSFSIFPWPCTILFFLFTNCYWINQCNFSIGQ